MDSVYHVPQDELHGILLDLTEMPGLKILQDVYFNLVMFCRNSCRVVVQ